MKRLMFCEICCGSSMDGKKFTSKSKIKKILGKAEICVECVEKYIAEKGDEVTKDGKKVSAILTTALNGQKTGVRRNIQY